jgi:molybdate transport system regulatory protein
MATAVTTSMSARNQISGTIKDIHYGQAMSVVTIRVGEKEIVSAVTNEACKELGLKSNDRVTAIIKSTEPILITGDEGSVKLSARNKVTGHVTAIQKGDAMACVTLESGGLRLTASITREAADDLRLNNGDRVTAAFKATEVMLQKL